MQKKVKRERGRWRAGIRGSAIVPFVIVLLFAYLLTIPPRLVVQVNSGVTTLFVNNHSEDTLIKPELFGINSDRVEKFSYTSFDGLKLKVIKIPALQNLSKSIPEEVGKGAIIFLHGVRRHKEQVYPMAAFFSAAGYDCYAPDLRSHGESEGRFTTYGFKEMQDVSRLIDTISRNYKNGGSIILWGQSMGAATAMLTMAQDNRVTAGIVESTFSDFREVVGDYFVRDIGFRSKPVLSYMIWGAGILTGLDASQISPLEYSSRISAPVLLVHGTADKKIDISHAHRIYARLKSPGSRFLQVEKARHTNIWETGGDLYFKRVLEFLQASK
jgi:alpha-beta hydrolase superfamily lysophospholipase